MEINDFNSLNYEQGKIIPSFGYSIAVEACKLLDECCGIKYVTPYQSNSTKQAYKLCYESCDTKYNNVKSLF